MKITKNALAGKVFLVFAAICLLVSSIDAMLPTKYTKKSLSIRQPILRQGYGGQARQMGLEKVWVRTSDGQIVELPKWQIDQMKVLQVFFVHQRGKNSEKNPIDASMISYENLMLMQKALNIAGNLGEFALFCENLMPEQKANLINAAFAVEAIGLAALLAEETFSPEIQETLGTKTLQSASIIAPVMKYLQKNQKKIFKKRAEEDYTDPVLFSPNGKYIIATTKGNINKSIKQNLILLNEKTGEEIKQLIGFKYGLSCVAFSYDGNYIVAGAYMIADKPNLMLYDIHDLNKVVYKELETDTFWGIRCVAFSPNEMKFVSGGVGAGHPNLILWNISNIDKVTSKELVGHPFFEEQQAIRSVTFSHDGKYILTASDGRKNNLILWDAKTGEIIKVLKGHYDDVRCVAFSPDDNYIVSCSKGKTNNLILWDAKIGEIIKVLEGHNDDVYCVAFSPSGDHIISGSSGNQKNLLLWDISPITIKNKIPNILFTFKNYEYGNFPKDIILLIGQNLIELSKLDINYQELKGYSYKHEYGTGGVYSVGFSPDGKYIVSYGVEEKFDLILWKTETAEKIRSENGGHSLYKTDMMFSPNSKSMVYPAEHGLVLLKLVDPHTFNFIATKLNIAQARLLYRLYLAKINDVSVVLDPKDLDYQIYLTLPDDVQQVIKEFLPFEMASNVLEKQIQDKMNRYRPLVPGATIAEKIKMVKAALARKTDKNSVEYKAFQSLLLELEMEAAFED